MDKELCDFLSSMQSRLFEFYKEGKLTNVTWIVGAEDGEEEYIDAHSSICALSTRLKELMLAHSKGQMRIRIRIPPSLTSSPSDLRSLLHLAYTGSFEEDRSLDDYFRLCDLFDMPLGIDACLRALNNLLTELLFRSNIDNETQNSLRDYFALSIDNSTMKSVRRAMLDFFRMYPLIFDTELCLSKVPVEWVMELLKRGQLWMRHPDGFVYFGEKYMSEVTQFVERLCAAHIVDPIEVKVATTNSMFAPLHVSNSISPSFGYHSMYAANYNYSEFEGEYQTHDNYPPNEWKIGALTGHITKDWDGRRVLAGLDVTYRNLQTGVEETVEWGRHNEEYYTVQKVFVPEDDVITGFEINHGWLIDHITFTTRGGARLDQLGSSDGGNRTVFDVSSFSSGVMHEWTDSRRTENKSDDVIVSLHGISYKEISSHGQILWNQVAFHFASVDRSIIETLNPEWGSTVHQMLKGKQILL
ncbi:BTB:POZ domain containing protein [Echinococcus multilocularis]|uniref:BTB:POZ domain containing protein n=1 Tax=Echinococcus multilocularis TaxID=6211 RepID=A0A087W0V9_ECHMU|nr:BTB:POZ domain containing protein [Echinococcus multilocularis]